MPNKGKYNNVHDFVDIFINNHIKENMICIDATLGNGYDTIKIKNKLFNTGKIYSFDIQEIAIENSKNNLNKEFQDNTNIFFINDGHENLNKYINNEKIDFFILNLGYLPGGDKNITTNYDTVIKFINSAIQLMNKNGLGIIVFYPGHIEGKEELIKISEYLKCLDQKLFNVFNINFLNQKNQPPQIIILERI